MPLSAEEQRMLEQLEASLADDDPKFAHSMGAKTPRHVQGRRAGLAGLGFLLGLVLLIAGMQTVWVLSVIGFIAMLASTVIAIGAWQRATSSGETSAPPKRPTNSGRPGRPFMDRMEDRWRRRQEGDV